MFAWIVSVDFLMMAVYEPLSLSLSLSLSLYFPLCMNLMKKELHSLSDLPQRKTSFPLELSGSSEYQQEEGIIRLREEGTCGIAWPKSEDKIRKYTVFYYSL